MYGWDTKSWRNSTENRQQKAECAEVTKRYLAGELVFEAPAIRIQCTCPARAWPHDPLEVHGKEWPLEFSPRKKP